MTTAVERRSSVAAPKDEAFPIRLRELRQDAGLTQFSLAVKSGIQINTIARLEQGVTGPTWATVRKLAEALGVGVEAFAQPPTGTGKPKKSTKPKRPEK